MGSSLVYASPQYSFFSSVENRPEKMKILRRIQTVQTAETDQNIEKELRRPVFTWKSPVASCVKNSKRPDIVMVRKNLKNEPTDYWSLASRQTPVWKSKKRREKVLRPCLRIKRLWFIKTTVIPIIINVLETIPKCLVTWAETIKTTVLLRSARILRRILKTWGDLLSLKLQWKTISKH